jgi:CheY-like chemotaxis protein
MENPIRCLISRGRARKRSQEEAHRRLMRSRLVPLQPWTVLIIDDEPEEARQLIEDLEDLGFRVVFAASGQLGLEMMQKEKPDTIICDLEMPGLDGYDVLEVVAGAPNARSLPFILMHYHWTVGPNGNWSRARKGKTADTHLPKPCNPLEIATFIGRIAGVL